jgi:putative oxidoreductase
MSRIEIDEVVQPRAATVGQTLLRAVVGMVVAGHGVEKLIHLRSFQGELIQVGVPNPEVVAAIVAGVELLAGLCLVFGRWTRTSAFAVLCDAVAVIVMIGMQHRARELLPVLESAALLLSASVYFLSAGSGVFSADTALRRRARLKALREDEIWQQYPYVVLEGDGGPDTSQHGESGLHGSA